MNLPSMIDDNIDEIAIQRGSTIFVPEWYAVGALLCYVFFFAPRDLSRDYRSKRRYRVLSTVMWFHYRAI